MLKIVTVIIVICQLNLCFGAAAKAWEPEEKQNAGGKALHHKFLEETKKYGKTIEIVFYGASLTEYWSGNGKEVWAQHYANLHAVNYGVGGDSTQNVIWRMQNGEIEGLHPKLIVLDIGANNKNRGDSDEDIAKGIKTILDIIHTKLPQTKVLVLGCFPQAKSRNLYEHFKRINSITSTYSDNQKVFFLDLTSAYEDSEHNIKPALYVSDGVHLTAAGYKVWAETMDPLFKHILSIK